MVQVIGQGRVQPKSFGQQIGEGVSRLASGTANHLVDQRERGLQEKRQQEEVEAISRLTGMDLSGVTDPKILQKAAEMYFGSGKKAATSFQSIPTEVSQAMNQIVSSLPEAKADDLKMAFDELGVPPGYSNPYVENRRRQDERKAASKDKKLESGQKRAEKVLDRADKIGEELPILESSIMAMEDAITNGDQSFWSLDNLAEATGFELFRTAKGGQFKTAAKTYFINDLKTSGARPNMFIEKQLSDALAKVGRSEEANLTVIESFKFSNDLKKKWVQTTRDLERYYEDSIGYLPGNFNSRVQEIMEPYVKDRQEEYEKKLKDLHVQEKKKSMNKGKKSKSESMVVQVRGPDGQLYETESENIEQLPEGYIVQ